MKRIILACMMSVCLSLPGFVPVTAAVAKAKDIVNHYIAEGDYNKLYDYRKEICNLTSYNKAAAGNGVRYGNPWQLVWVFDEDPTTNVVCEGYAKAFQYLCDLSDFKSSKVECHTVTGTMSGETGYKTGQYFKELSF